MIGLGNNTHIFARAQRREGLRYIFEELLRVTVLTVQHPGMAETMLVVRFPNGGSLSIEFTPDAADSDEPRFDCWLELRSVEPRATIEILSGADIREVKHAGHPYYFMAPGGQVFTIVQGP